MASKTEAKKKDFIREQVFPVLYLLLILFAIRWTFIEPYVVPTGSMEPTLKTGDKLFALKCSYDVRFPFTDWILFRTGAVRRGDVILFRAPHDPSITYVKRAIGIPGDTVEMRSGTLFVNGEEVPKFPKVDTDVMYDIPQAEHKTLWIETLGKVRHYVIHNDLQPSTMRNFGPIQIPEGNYYAIGDNRDNSYDSRFWGFVPAENLKGRAMFIWLSSWNREPVESTLASYLMVWNWRFRWERVGTALQ